MVVKKGKFTELYKALVDQVKESEVADDEFTVAEFALDVGTSRRVAISRLNNLLKSGKITKRQAIREGRRVAAYRFK